MHWVALLMAFAIALNGATAYAVEGLLPPEAAAMGEVEDPLSHPPSHDPSCCDHSCHASSHTLCIPGSTFAAALAPASAGAIPFQATPRSSRDVPPPTHPPDRV